MAKMIECEIHSIRVSLTNHDRIVVLQEKDNERYLPIWIGVYESEAITIALQKIVVARPLTHDLLKALIDQLGGRLVAVEISAIEADTFYAQLVLEVDGVRKHVDCRPSDAIALMVRTQVPLYVAEEVMEQSAIEEEIGQDFEDVDVNISQDEPFKLDAFQAYFEERGQEDDGDEELPSDPEPDDETD